jgi:integrase/recombinase XerD
MKQDIEPQISDLNPIEGINPLIHARLQWLRHNNYRPATVQTQAEALRKFQGWCLEQGLQAVSSLSVSHLEAYQRWLYHQKTKQGRLFSVVYQHKLLLVLKACFHWASEQGGLLYNPAAYLVLPRLPQRPAKRVLTVAEIETVLAQPSLETPVSLRDKTLLEVLYASALRRGELLRLNQQDIDFDYALLHLRQTKGHQDRKVPISPRALEWIKRYQQQARPTLQQSGDYPDDDALFLSRKGRRLHADTCKDQVDHYLQQALQLSGGCHLIRHSVATLLLNEGADIRVIQSFLGHRHLKTTQQYLHVNTTQLKKVYQQYHPLEQGKC